MSQSHSSIVDEDKTADDVAQLETVAEIGEIPILSVANSSSITKVKNEELDDFNPLVFSGRLESPPTFTGKADEASWADFKSPKTKLVLDCVFINPSSAMCAENDTQDALAKLKAMQNPKLKLKKKKDEEMQFPLNPNTILPLLDAMKTFTVTLPLAERSVTVSREFMNWKFGGGTQRSLATIREERVKEHGYNDFLYLTKEVEPLAPSIPGQPGLFFSTSKDYTPCWMEEPFVFRVFIRLTTGCWLYQGQYKFAHCKTLTATEWSEQGEKVKNTWAYKLARHQWGLDVRGRISFREQFGRDPSGTELRGLVAEETMMTKTKEAFPNITKEKILSEFDAGNERMVIWKMECVQYDEEFQRRIAAEYKEWEVNHRSSGSNGKKRKPSPAAPSSRKSNVRQRYGSDLSEQNRRETRSEVEVRYVPRGTKSRPLVV
ncbi:hypothetical protein C8R42DRAFT_658158 [Lentinula raphanica]|nr:hypothetical protein C8R42DRAFT_658158 [Lentinula raphanica]